MFITRETTLVCKLFLHNVHYSCQNSLQNLFRVYPKRAVRHVLNERSRNFTESVTEAETHLRSIYCRPCPYPEQLATARALYDYCKWMDPTSDDSDDLDQPPNCQEIRLKFKRATNTAPGSDRVEYRHLRSLDRDGHILGAILGAVWRLGIPDS